MAKGIVASMGWLWDESVAESRAFIDSAKSTVGYPGFLSKLFSSLDTLSSYDISGIQWLRDKRKFSSGIQAVGTVNVK